eukprot:gene10374-2903_t
MLNNKRASFVLSPESEYFKKNIEPVLTFFEIKPSGNLFRDVLGIAQMADHDNIEELLIKKIFHYYCIDDGTKMKSKDLKFLMTDVNEAGDVGLKDLTDEDCSKILKKIGTTKKDNEEVIEWEAFKNWWFNDFKDSKDLNFLKEESKEDDEE